MSELPATPYHPHQQHRALAFGRQAAIAGQSWLANLAGAHVLQEGGNAVDAAISIAAVECVALPMYCGVGGEAFALVQAPDGRTFALNSSGAAPLASSAEEERQRGRTLLPFRGMESAALPGEVAAWGRLHAEFGSMPWERLLAPAIAFAEAGVPLDQRQAAIIASLADEFDPAARAVFLPGGRPPRPGDRLAQPELARVLREVAAGGPAAFYRGPVAERLVAALQAGGSRYTREDFAAHQVEWYPPLRHSYRGYEVVTTRPVSPGVVMLEALGLLEGFELRDPLDPGTIHLQVEALRLAFADRRRWLGDPRVVAFPVETLFSEAFLVRRRRAIDLERAGAAAPAGPFDFEGETTSFVIADRAGWGVSFIHSISALGGAGVLAAGILLNNRLGRGFTLEPDHPNELAPGKRTMHTLTCYQVHRNGRWCYLGGTPGGDGQPQWNVQVLSLLLDFGMNVQEASEWPRWLIFPATDPHTLADPPRLDLDGRYPPRIAAALAARGHPVRQVAPWDPGRIGAAVQLIARDQERDLFSAGSDPRGAGGALAW
ncbi:MAG: gamma-glutamyltranspeptidase [Dehalococcoidia bacterium]|nr:MAG: gamma-glutamyltranspeptidase [Dehalococcoidia bacterium]